MSVTRTRTSARRLIARAVVGALDEIAEERRRGGTEGAVLLFIGYALIAVMSVMISLLVVGGMVALLLGGYWYWDAGIVVAFLVLRAIWWTTDPEREP